MVVGSSVSTILVAMCSLVNVLTNSTGPLGPAACYPQGTPVRRSGRPFTKRRAACRRKPAWNAGRALKQTAYVPCQSRSTGRELRTISQQTRGALLLQILAVAGTTRVVQTAGCGQQALD